MALDQQIHPLAQLLDELGRPDDPRVLAEPQHPRDQLAGIGVGRKKDPVAVFLGGTHLPVGAEVTLDLPRDSAADPHLGGAHRVAELPVDPVGVHARVEVGGALEVVLGLGRVADLAANPRQPEHADRLAFVGVADEVELVALEQQLVGVDLARAELAALHREVVEHDRLAAEDRGLDLGQALTQLVAARGARYPERDRVLLGRAERARAAPRDLLEREAERLGVGELAVEQVQSGIQPGELPIGELDRRQVEVLGRERVRLLLDQPVDRLLDRQEDPERLELGAIRVKAARKRVLIHRAVALDVAPNLLSGDRTPFCHQVRDERQLTDQLFRVLSHALSTL